MTKPYLTPAEAAELLSITREMLMQSDAPRSTFGPRTIRFPLLSLSLAVVGCVATTGWWRTGRIAFLLGGFPLALAGVIIAGLSPTDAVLRFARWLIERALDGRALWILACDIVREGPAEFRRIRRGLQ